MELDNVFTNRRSVRFFENEQPDLELVKQVISAGQYAPRASNRQHWEAVVVTDPEARKRLVEEGGAQRTVIKAPVIAVIIVDTRYNVANYDNIQSASAAAQNMILKAVDVGLGGCWVVGFGSKENVKKILDIPDYFDPMCYLLFGKRNDKIRMPTMPPKKTVQEIIHVGKYTAKTTYLPNSVRPKHWTLAQIGEHQRYVSRARHLGIDYDFYIPEEINKINYFVRKYTRDKQRIGVLLGYDGTILRNMVQALENKDVYDVELADEIIDFVKFKTEKPEYSIFGKHNLQNNPLDVVFLPYALERVPELKPILQESNNMLKQSGNTVIFFKNKFSFYGLMYFAIVSLLGLKKLEGFYIRSGPFEPVNVFKLKRALKQTGFKVKKTSSMFFLPGEVSIFQDRLDGYLKRHEKKLSSFKYFIKPTITLTNWFFNLTKWIKLAHISSSVCVVAEKQGQ